MASLEVVRLVTVPRAKFPYSKTDTSDFTGTKQVKSVPELQGVLLWGYAALPLLVRGPASAIPTLW